MAAIHHHPELWELKEIWGEDALEPLSHEEVTIALWSELPFYHGDEERDMDDQMVFNYFLNTTLPSMEMDLVLNDLRRDFYLPLKSGSLQDCAMNTIVNEYADTLEEDREFAIREQTEGYYGDLIDYYTGLYLKEYESLH